jgi:preprotein translocase subunit Sec63
MMRAKFFSIFIFLSIIVIASSSKNYYRILGVSKSATLKQIKKAYRKLAITNHPDRNKNDPKAKESFVEIAKAYEGYFLIYSIVLSNKGNFKIYKK